MRILYYDNCWFTNVGEAFIDIGAMEALKLLYPGAKIATISNMSHYYVPPHKSRKRSFWGLLEKEDYSQRDNVFDLNSLVTFWEFDLLVLAGMFMSETHLTGKVSEFVRLATKHGAKVAFWGLGAESGLSAQAIDEFIAYINEIAPVFITTRDKKTYEYIKSGGYTKDLIQGIDAAFWVKDVFDPRGFSKESYDAVSFNRSAEPKCFSDWNKPVIRPWHMQWYAYEKEFVTRTFISDIPYDYISIYANAEKVYTDLVHATIIGLQYGKIVYYYKVDDRSDAFLDLSIIQTTDDGGLYLNELELEKNKTKIINTVSKLI